MPEYTVMAAVAVVVVIILERAVVRSGIFRSRTFWISLAICLFFMVLVNGWLTKLSAPIVLYDPDMKTPWRFPWDIPVEDYLFGFALLAIVLARWQRAGHRPSPRHRRFRRPVDQPAETAANRPPDRGSSSSAS